MRRPYCSNRKQGGGSAREAIEAHLDDLEDFPPAEEHVGAPLKGEHGGYWRWRLGDYRVIARIEDEKVTILVVRGRSGERPIAEAVALSAASSPSRPSSRLCVFA